MTTFAELEAKAKRGEMTVHDGLIGYSLVDELLKVSDRVKSRREAERKWKAATINYALATAPCFGLTLSGMDASLPNGDRA